MTSRIGCAALLLASAVASRLVLAADFIVSHPGDTGPGSLAHAIQQANQHPGEDRIRFVSDLFQEPYTFDLQHPLPVITDSLIIDGYIPDRLWQPSGITLDGGGQFRLFDIPADVQVTLRYLTLSHGKAEQGGAIRTAGTLTLDSMLVIGNQANEGGAIYQQGGQLAILNSTLLNNQARQQGGAVFSSQGNLTLVHNTITANQAPEGAGLFRLGPVHLANNIVALNQPGKDAECRNGRPGPHTNLIMTADGCGTAAFTDDPRLGTLGYYNGPTRSLPLRGNSPAINQADNTLSVGRNGEPLSWDQRGNGDPRFAGGIADLGAFEKQSVMLMQVDTLSDEDLRRCTRLREDCSLRGAIMLLNAADTPGSLTLDPRHFPGKTTLQLTRPLPRLQQDIVLRLLPGQTLDVVGHGGLPQGEGVRFSVQHAGSHDRE